MCLHCALCSIPFDLLCNMIMFKNMLNFDLLTPRVRVGGGLPANICSQVVAFVNPFNLICKMTMF